MPSWMETQRFYNKVQTTGYTQNNKVRLDFARKHLKSLQSTEKKILG